MRALVGLARAIRRNLNLLIVVGVFGTMLGLAVVSGHWLFYRAAYAIGGLIPVGFLWARLNLRGLEVRVERAADRLQVGERTEARVSISSRTFYTKLWLEMEDPTTMPGVPARAVVSLPAHGHRNWKVSAPCTRRGAFSVGPIKVTAGDPFGLFRFSRSFGASSSLLVLPLPEELPYFAAPPSQLSGEGTVRRRTPYVTPNAAGVRDYHPGDSFNRIHWRSTARLNQLMVKTFEMDPSSEIWVLMDLYDGAQVGRGDDSTEEYGVRIAASLANHFLSANRMLGLMAFGKETVALDPARGAKQYMRVLEALSLARAEGKVPLSRVLQEEERRFGRHSTLVVVTPSEDEEWVAALQSLSARGARTAAVLMEPGSFGAAGSAILPFSTLVASGVLTYLVRRGDDLSLALGPNGGTRGSLPWQRVGARQR